MPVYTLRKVFILLTVVVIISPSMVIADGMIVPPPDYWMRETDQKAVIFYDQGVETLVISASFQGNAEDFGWVIPTPAMPTVARGSDELFTSLQELTGQTYQYEQPLSRHGGADDVSTGSITIVETKQVDYYDVTVLTSDDKDALVSWLKENKYEFPTSASYILDSYIENGWFFVAMRVNPQSLEWLNVGERLRSGHATPVVISFPTQNIVYPLRISSVTNRPTYSSPSSLDVPHTPTYAITQFGNGVAIGAIGTLSFPADIFPYTGGTAEFWLAPDSAWETSESGYWELISIVNPEGKDIFELRRGKDATYDNIQLTGYNPVTTSSWKTADAEPLTWDSSQAYYIAVTWLETSEPQIFVNGVPLKTEASYSGGIWSLLPYPERGMMYFGQRKSDSGLSALRGNLLEVRISSSIKTSAEVATTYQQFLNSKEFDREGSTLLLAHLDRSLTEEISGRDLAYTEVTNNYEDLYPAIDQSASIVLYVIADKKKSAPEFSTTFANTIDRESIKQLALDSQGNPLLNPTQEKYSLTTLSRTMAYSDMNEDLFLRDAPTNDTIGRPITRAGHKSMNPFYIVIGVAVVLSAGLVITILLMNQKSPPPAGAENN
ncbi:MAG: DUF2330 domain-containing protein [Parcubacteria group bacterium]